MASLLPLPEPVLCAMVPNVAVRHVPGVGRCRSAQADVLEGEPVLVVEDGRIVEQALGGAGTLSRRELLMELRQQGVRNVGELERAFFEPGGKISVLRASPGNQKETESAQPGNFRRKGT